MDEIVLHPHVKFGLINSSGVRTPSGVIYQPLTDGPKWGAMPLTRLMLDAKLPAAQQLYRLSQTPIGQSSCIYIIRYRDNGSKCQHSRVVKVGRGKRCLRRLCCYKTYNVLDDDILIVAVLVVPEPGLICALEDLLLRQLDAWSEAEPTKVKRIRRTEWFYRLDGTTESLVLHTLLDFTMRIANLMPALRATLHLYSISTWTRMIKLDPQVNYPVDYTLKGKKRTLTKIEEAEALLIPHNQLEGFTKAEASKKLPKGWLS